jgi:leucyl-tRNA synthetase
MTKYDPSKIEPKWQKVWDKEKVFAADDSSTKPKWYSLIEFPYPSGVGLHVGHILSNTAMDIISRKRRMEGYNVLYPIGWDAFGLPTENYAIKTGISPQVATKKNTDNFRAQLKSMGFSFDWDREIDTTDPEYYKWTQWMFLQFYKHGLAYKAKAEINWCPKDKIGLANEEVENGKCERCGGPVEQKTKEQWMLKITAYAEKLLDGLKTVDYLPEIKAQQENWIGRSEGALLQFTIKNSQLGVEVFTTRPDTLFGATYLVLAPEHSIVSSLKSEVSNLGEVEKYITATKLKNDLDRTEAKEKTGVELKGIKAINPATKEEIPVWIGDYVLATYGTGAIMAVPAHDERDFEFARKFNLSVKQVIAPLITVTGNSKPREGKPVRKKTVVTGIIRNPKTDEFLIQRLADTDVAFTGGGVEDGEDIVDALKREVIEETGYTDFVVSQRKFPNFFGKGYKLKKDTNCFDYEYFYEVELLSTAKQPISSEEAAKHTLEWVPRNKVKETITLDTHHFIWDVYSRKSEFIYTDSGQMINSGKFDGMPSEEAKKAITEFVGGKTTVKYKLRDWVFSRQRYWGEPIPLVHCEKDGWVAVPDDELPVKLPEVENYQPRDDGQSPLASIESWVKTKCPTCKGEARRETDTMPNWAGSSWYFLRYLDPDNKKIFADKEKMKHWLPVDWYNGGMEHSTRHLLYSRFWNLFLHDIGEVPVGEPYKKRTSNGIILGSDGTKMSKSVGNVVNPDELVKEFGADALRLYEMFIGQFSKGAAWDQRGILGTARFLERVWKISEQVFSATSPVSTEEKIARSLHKTIKKVSDDIEAMNFNTAISAMMIFVNEVTDAEYKISNEDLRKFLKVLSPFAPHIAEELWELGGGEGLIARAAWPVVDPVLLVDDTFELLVQINGKIRAKTPAPKGISQEKAEEIALKMDEVKRWVSGVPKKVVFVKDRLINFIV